MIQVHSIRGIRAMRAAVLPLLIAGAVISGSLLGGCGQMEAKKTEAAAMTKEQLIERGKYLITIGGCNDCHTTKIFGEGEPRLDMNRLMAGHPADSKLPPIDPAVVQKGWALMAMDATSFVGPWGVTYAANLTPDKQTGIGAWSRDVFIATLRNGKHMGSGRPILPPMPWQGVGMATDEDLAAMYEYLMSLPPVYNPVPAPLPPTALATLNK